jgi:hypothetical protein
MVERNLKCVAGAQAKFSAKLFAFCPRAAHPQLEGALEEEVVRTTTAVPATVVFKLVLLVLQVLL